MHGMLNRRELLAGTLASGVAAQSQSAQAQAGRRPTSCTSCRTSSSGPPSPAGPNAARQTWTAWRRRACSSSAATRHRRSAARRAPCCSRGAYHWHNGVYNQVHSSPSVHRDMNPDVVLYSQRLRDAGYRQGYVGKWHASLGADAARFRFPRGRRPVRLRSRAAATSWI